MADAPVTPGTAPVKDSRQVPRGVLPRGAQTWLMGGLALVVLAVILLTGRTEPPDARVPAPTASQTTNPDRVRDYQERLRTLETRAREETQAGALETAARQTPYSEPPSPPPEDPLVAERRRREYESLFASNVVLSRRPESERPDMEVSRRAQSAAPETFEAAATPSIEEIADAAVRATARVGAALGPPLAAPTTVTASAPSAALKSSAETPPRSERGQPISATGPLHAVLEGTIIDTVLTNRLDGDAAAPVNCLVTNALYSHSGQHVLIPAGARILGETRPVQSLGESRLAVAFHRLVMPDGRTYSLEQVPGLNQIGDSGLRDQVNQHYWSTFGAAGAVGLISGLAQYVGTSGIGSGGGDRTVIIAGGAADAASQASLQVMNRFLNRLPTVTVREGHRVKVYLTRDLELPAYDARNRGPF